MKLTTIFCTSLWDVILPNGTGKGQGMQGDIIMIGILLLLVLWIIIEQRLLMTTKYTITIPGSTQQLNKINFVVLADLHNCNFGKNNKRLVHKIDTLSPDLILVAGDMINKRAVCYPSNAYTLLEQLSHKYKIYYAYGNHEQRMEQLGKTISVHSETDNQNAYSTWVEYKQNLINNNVMFLDNQSIVLEIKGIKLRITGVSIDAEYFEFHTKQEMEEDYLNNLLGESSKDQLQLLIAHNPIYFTSYSRWGASLTLAGHMHGGLMRLPGIGGVLSPQAKFFPKYDMGLHTHEGKHLVVSRGLGSHSIMPRLFNIPELIYISLQREV